MNSQQATARRIGIALVAACSMLLTSCAAGQHAATARQTPAIDAVNGTIGNLDLRAVAIVAPADGTTSYPEGAAAAVTLAIVNNGSSDDSLTGVTTSVATSWAVFKNAAEAAAVTAAGASSSKASGSASPSAVATLPAGATSLAVPAGQSTSFGVPSAEKVLLLLGLTKKLFTAQTVSVTFKFDKAGTVTLSVPVQLSTSPVTSVVPVPTSAAE